MSYLGRPSASQAGRRKTGRYCGPSTLQFSHVDREQPFIYSSGECPFNSSSCFQVEDAALAQYRNWSGPRRSRDCQRVLVGMPTARDSAVVFPDGHYESMPLRRTMCVGKYPSLCLQLSNNDDLLAYDVVSEMYRFAAGPNDGPATL